MNTRRDLEIAPTKDAISDCAQYNKGTIDYPIESRKDQGEIASGKSRLVFGIRKIGRMEDGKGENFRSTHTSNQMHT